MKVTLLPMSRARFFYARHTVPSPSFAGRTLAHEVHINHWTAIYVVLIDLLLIIDVITTFVLPSQ